MACTYLIPGINRVFFGIWTESLEYYYNSNEDVVLSGDTVFFEVTFSTASITQKRTADARGVYFAKEFSFTIPPVGDNNESRVYELEGRSLLIAYVDSGGRWFITGHDSPYSLDKQDKSIASDDDSLEVTLTNNSYCKIEKFSQSIIFI